MDDASFVGGFEPFCDLAAHIERFVDRQGAALQPLAQVFSGHQLQRQEAHVVNLVHTMDAGDVRVVERGQRPGFAFEPSQATFVIGEVCGQHLDRHLAVEPGVPCAVDLAHAPGTERAEDLVEAQGLAGGQGHAA